MAVCWPDNCDVYAVRRVGQADPASVLVCRRCGCCFEPRPPHDVTIP